MIYFITLDGEKILYKGNFKVHSVDSFNSQRLISKYFAQNENLAQVAVFICIDNCPIWTMASYGELWETIAPPNFHQLSPQEQSKITDIFDDFNHDELEDLKMFANKRVLPYLRSLCHKSDPSKTFIMDVRKAFRDEGEMFGFICAD